MGWYTAVYGAFLLGIFPPFLFARPLIQRHRGQQPYFSAFTCWLGLGTWTLIVGAIAIAGLLAILRRWGV